MIRSKDHLVSALSTQFGFSEKQSSQILEWILEWIMDAIEEGDEVRLLGFGSFWAQLLEAKEKVNPRTGRSFVLETRNNVMFKGAKEFRQRLNEGVNADSPEEM